MFDPDRLNELRLLAVIAYVGVIAIVSGIWWLVEVLRRDR